MFVAKFSQNQIHFSDRLDSGQNLAYLLYQATTNMEIHKHGLIDSF
jgi:hypothetical protein